MKDLFRLLTRKTSQRDYVARMTKTMTDYSISRADLSFKFAQDYLEESSNLLTEETIKFIKERIIKIHTIGLDDIEAKVDRESLIFYKYQHGRTIPQEDEDKKIKAEVVYRNYSLEQADQSAISSLSSGQMIWFKDHASGSEVVKDVERVLIESHKNKLTGDQTTGVLRTYFSSFTPKEYAKKFGEASYWKGFQLNQATLLRNEADLSRFDKAGIEYYQIYARKTERTCDRCLSFHGQIYKVKDARSRMGSYFDAVTSNDLKAMKKVSNWAGKGKSGKPATDTELSKKGTFTPFHFKCECYLKYYTKAMKERDATRFSNVGSPQMRKTAEKAFSDDPEINAIVDYVKDKITYKTVPNVKGGAYYSPSRKQIVANVKHSKNPHTFRHEFGHAVSDLQTIINPQALRIFETTRDKFMKQFTDQKITLVDRLQARADLKAYLEKNDDNKALSDMISGISLNTLKGARYGHKNKYWLEDTTNPLEEFIANYFEVRGNLNPTNLEQVREFFPELTDYLDKQFTKISKRGS